MEDKRELRKHILTLRDNLSLDTRKQYDKEIFSKLINKDCYKDCKCIFIFVSYKSEIDTHSIIKKALEDKKVVCVPKVISKQEGMKAVQITDFNQLKPGCQGILEPVDFKCEVDVKKIDLVIMPGVAFDLNGGRIGYGGGFYDRFLVDVRKEVPKVALAYDIQIVDKVPMNELDMRVDDIITNG